jgi:hypothetical protein
MLHYQWGIHPNISPNFIEDETEITIPDCEMYVRYASQQSDILQGAKGNWPMIPSKSGGNINMSIFNTRKCKADDFTLLRNPKSGFIEINNKRKKLKLKFEWDNSTFKHCSIWRVNGNDLGYPRYGTTVVLGFVITNDLSWGLDHVDKESDVILPGEEKSCWYNIIVE